MLALAGKTLATLGRRYVRAAPFGVGRALLARYWLNAYLRERPRRRVVEASCGARFAVDTRDLIQRYLYLFGVWEPHMTRWLKSRLRPGDVLVDVGANIGVFAVLGSRLVGDEGRVVAVEASPVLHRRMLRHVQLNGCGNVRAVNAAVSDKQETLRFVLASSKNMGANSIVPYEGPTESSFQTDALPLTEILERDELVRARVVKIDVEGAEGRVVRGLAPLLDQLPSDVEIAVEVTPERMAQLGESAEELLEVLRKHGFHVYRLPNDYAPAAYARAVWHPAAPVRYRGPIEGETQLIFSRIDAEVLA